MEQHIAIFAELLRDEVKLVHLSKTSSIPSQERGCIYMEKYRLQTCPNEMHILSSMEKRIRRSDALRDIKGALSICVALLLSTGYSVRSLVLKSIDDSAIERCWECVCVTSHNIPSDQSGWMAECLKGRQTTGFSTMYCQSGLRSVQANYLGSELSRPVGAAVALKDTNVVPATMWNRNDVLMYATIIHAVLE